MFRNNQILCDDKSNPDPNKKCQISSRPKQGSYYCIYCGRVMDKDIINEEETNSDIKFIDNNNSGRLTNVDQGVDTSKMVLEGNDKETSEIKKKFTEVFDLLEIGKDALGNAMELYGKYQYCLINHKPTKSDNEMKSNVQKRNEKTMRKINVIKGIVLIVLESRNIPFDKIKFERKLGWKYADMRKQQERFKQIVPMPPIVPSIERDEEIREKCNKLGIGENTTKCIDVYDEISNIFEGKRSNTLIACSIYCVCQLLKITINENVIAKECNSTIKTIKNMFQSLNSDDKMKKIEMIVKK